MRREELDRLWNDPRNWTGLGVYRCPADPRVIVRKRRRWAGWTINFSHPHAMVVLLVTLLIAILPPLIVLAADLLKGNGPRVGHVLLAALGSTAVLILLGMYGESRTD